MRTLTQINGHTPIPRDDRRDTYGPGPVVVRPMTEYERAWLDSLKPPKKNFSGPSHRTVKGQL